MAQLSHCYETALPPEIYDLAWERLTAAEGASRGLGAQLGSTTAPLAGIAHYLFHAHAWSAREACDLQDLLSTPAPAAHQFGIVNQPPTGTGTVFPLVRERK